MAFQDMADVVTSHKKLEKNSKSFTMQSSMNWEKLLTTKRVSEFSKCGVDVKKSNFTDVRSPFERDWDQLIFSYPFRRLQDKTQVIPFPEFDFVHTRLTHSLEVASVGRSLGTMVAPLIFNELSTEYKERSRISLGDIGTLVGAACLAHDIGNPPFGHSGESSISYYFKHSNNDFQPFDMAVKYFLTNDGEEYKWSYKNGQDKEIGESYIFNRKNEIAKQKRWQDLSNFEGNANGFRIITRNCEKGINPTAALLGVFTKYPRESWLEGIYFSGKYPKVLSKYGFFQTERDTFKALVEEIGLLPFPSLKGDDIAYCRHPLAFLMEAADDITYGIIDFEDGCRLGLIDLEKHYGTLQIKDKDGKFQNVVINSTPREILQEIASLDSSFDKEKVNGSEDNFKEVISYLRSKVINVLAHKCFEVFGNHYKTIMSGEFYEPLISCINDSQIIDGLFKMQSLVRRYVYNYKPVLKSEASGFEVMHSLIESLAISSNICISCGDPQDEKANKLRSLLPDEYSPKEEKELKNLTQVEIYERVMSVLDYVSGMTDNYAMSLFRSIKGISSH